MTKEMQQSMKWDKVYTNFTFNCGLIFKLHKKFKNVIYQENNPFKVDYQSKQ